MPFKIKGAVIGFSGGAIRAERARDKAQEWAEGAGEPGAAGTKSAKAWAEDAQAIFGNAAAVQAAVDAASGSATAAAGSAAAAAQTVTDLTDQVAGFEGRLAALETVGIDSLAVSPSGAQELGDTVSPTLTWAFVGTGTPTALAVNGVAVTPATATSYAAPDITGTTTYTVTVTDEQDRESSAQITVPFRNRIFWGALVAATPNAAQIKALAGTRLQANRILSETVETDAEYVVVAFPASFGAVVDYRLFGFAETPVVTTVQITTDAGFTGNYTVLRSPEPLTGAVPVEVS